MGISQESFFSSDKIQEDVPSFISTKTLKESLFLNEISRVSFKTIYTISGYPDYIVGAILMDKNNSSEMISRSKSSMQSEYNTLKELKLKGFKTVETYGVVDIVDDNSRVIGAGIIFEYIRGGEVIKPADFDRLSVYVYKRFRFSRSSNGFPDSNPTKSKGEGMLESDESEEIQSDGVEDHDPQRMAENTRSDEDRGFLVPLEFFDKKKNIFNINSQSLEDINESMEMIYKYNLKIKNIQYMVKKNGELLLWNVLSVQNKDEFYLNFLKGIYLFNRDGLNSGFYSGLAERYLNEIEQEQKLINFVFMILAIQEKKLSEEEKNMKENLLHIFCNTRIRYSAIGSDRIDYCDRSFCKMEKKTDDIMLVGWNDKDRALYDMYRTSHVFDLLNNLGFKTLRTNGIFDIFDGSENIAKGLLVQYIENQGILKGKSFSNMLVSDSLHLTVLSLKDCYEYIKRLDEQKIMFHDPEFLIADSGEFFLIDFKAIDKNKRDNLYEQILFSSILDKFNKEIALDEECENIIRKIFELLDLNKKSIIYALSIVLSDMSRSPFADYMYHKTWVTLIRDILSKYQLKDDEEKDDEEPLNEASVEEEEAGVQESPPLKEEVLKNSRWNQVILELKPHLFFQDDYGKKVLMYLENLSWDTIEMFKKDSYTNIFLAIVENLLRQHLLREFYTQDIQKASFPQKIWKFIYNGFKIMLIDFSQKSSVKKIKKLIKADQIYLNKNEQQWINKILQNKGNPMKTIKGDKSAFESVTISMNLCRFLLLKSA